MKLEVKEKKSYKKKSFSFSVKPPKPSLNAVNNLQNSHQDENENEDKEITI